jgi:hypothetical protein
LDSLSERYGIQFLFFLSLSMENPNAIAFHGYDGRKVLHPIFFFLAMAYDLGFYAWSNLNCIMISFEIR